VRHVDPRTSLASNKLVNHKSQAPKYIAKPVYIGHGISLCLAFCHVRSLDRETPTGTQTISTKRSDRDCGFPADGVYVAEIILLRISDSFARNSNDKR